ncbi:hypothetical protein [Actinoplanes derwentensis]|nr:hypothetical protein [Actinoplanes derwentensis]
MIRLGTARPGRMPGQRADACSSRALDIDERPSMSRFLASVVPLLFVR